MLDRSWSRLPPHLLESRAAHSDSPLQSAAHARSLRDSTRTCSLSLQPPILIYAACRGVQRRALMARSASCGVSPLIPCSERTLGMVHGPASSAICSCPLSQKTIPSIRSLSMTMVPPGRSPTLQSASSSFVDTLRTVLIVEIKRASIWARGGKKALMRQIERQADVALSDTARRRVYWVGAIGPRWIYGVKEDDGQGLECPSLPIGIASLIMKHRIKICSILENL